MQTPIGFSIATQCLGTATIDHFGNCPKLESMKGKNLPNLANGSEFDHLYYGCITVKIMHG
jgi:hypothetical protein